MSSWKEIAAYLGVTVRSVQRWEKTGGLPVRRLGRGRSARVVAFSGELDAWVRAGGASAARSLSNATQGRRPWWRRWRPLGAVAAVGLAILALALRILAAPGEPESWTWSGDGVLTVRDARSRTLWRKQFPGRQDKPAFATQPPVLIADIDGDGRREVLVQRLPSEPSRTPSSLFCFERTGRERWEFRYNARKTFGGRSFEPEFQPQLVLPVRIAGRGYLVTVANHRIWYPSQVALLDVHTGRLIEDYWHPGLIRHCLLRDLDGDGREELIFAGINNPGEGFGHAALGVLKLPFSQARRSPSRADDRFPPPTGGGEYRYVLCPTPDVNRVAGIWPIPTELSVDHLGRIRLALPLPESGAVVYYFDDTLSVVEARFSDNFAALHERYHRQRLLDHSLSARELAELQRVVSFPAAPDGNHPELRRFWQY
ncbi:MAG: helix-turn-helix domain-containing protein [Bryobacterales bacterium]|nr:helix-turn-helix domain-containing protein [Bryobacteraceae bacterium]MDW8130754.1 helix-turn-helix domain-containing protein [Bryobacterales bacterium]